MKPMDCNQADGLLDSWLDDELDSPQRTALDAHLDGCSHCGQLRDDLLQLRHAARGLDEAGLAAANWTALRQRLEASVGPLAQHTAAPQAVSGKRVSVSAFTWLSASLVAAAAAAGVGLAWWVDLPPRPAERLASGAPSLPVESDSGQSVQAQSPVTPAKPDRVLPDTSHRPAAPKPETVVTPPVMELARTPEPAAEPTPDVSEPPSAAPTEQTPATPTTPDTATPASDPADLLERLEALAQLTRGKTDSEDSRDPTSLPQEPLASQSLPVVTTDDLPGLAALLQDPLPATIRRNITQVLVDMEGEAVQEMLEQVLRSADPAESRATAAWTLAARGHADSRPALQHIVQHDPSAFVRNAARAALEKLDGDGRTGRTNR